MTCIADHGVGAPPHRIHHAPTSAPLHSTLGHLYTFASLRLCVSGITHPLAPALGGDGGGATYGRVPLVAQEVPDSSRYFAAIMRDGSKGLVWAWDFAWGTPGTDGEVAEVATWQHTRPPRPELTAHHDRGRTGKEWHDDHQSGDHEHHGRSHQPPNYPSAGGRGLFVCAQRSHVWHLARWGSCFTRRCS